MHKLVTVYEDERGHLFEIFRKYEWAPKMAYTVLTHPGYGRDENRWHYHREKTETFVCLSGEICLAVKRAGGIRVYTLTAGDGCFVEVGLRERHSVMNMSDSDAVLLVLCDQYYHPADELREDMDDWSWGAWAESQL